MSEKIYPLRVIGWLVWVLKISMCRCNGYGDCGVLPKRKDLKGSINWLVDWSTGSYFEQRNNTHQGWTGRMDYYCRIFFFSLKEFDFDSFLLCLRKIDIRRCEPSRRRPSLLNKKSACFFFLFATATAADFVYIDRLVWLEPGSPWWLNNYLIFFFFPSPFLSLNRLYIWLCAARVFFLCWVNVVMILTFAS